MEMTTAADPFDLAVAGQERQEKIKQALQAMSHVEQQVLLCHDRGFKSLAWIARRLGITKDEAREALVSARALLKGIPDL